MGLFVCNSYTLPCNLHRIEHDTRAPLHTLTRRTVTTISKPLPVRTRRCSCFVLFPSAGVSHSKQKGELMYVVESVAVHVVRSSLGPLLSEK